MARSTTPPPEADGTTDPAAAPEATPAGRQTLLQVLAPYDALDLSAHDLPVLTRTPQVVPDEQVDAIKRLAAQLDVRVHTTHHTPES